jgi:branched-subunit amino acid aminotransferase/4-amino-4-deoxychorismate lyase
VLDLAQPFVASGELSHIGHRDLGRDEVMSAREVFIFGTTPDVTAVVEFDGRKIGDGRPGPVWQILSGLLHRDILEGREHHIAI